MQSTGISAACGWIFIANLASMSEVPLLIPHTCTRWFDLIPTVHNLLGGTYYDNSKVLEKKAHLLVGGNPDVKFLGRA